MGGRGSASGGVKKRKGGKNQGTTQGEAGSPRGDETPSLPTKQRVTNNQ
jgi:hypothetical protein